MESQSKFGKGKTAKHASSRISQKMFNLGYVYYSEEDYQKALFWFERAADQGNAFAQHNLAVMYDTGEGVAKDYKKAVYWFEKAADQGVAVAQFSLGSMYNNGQGVAKNYQKAFYWYQKSANQGLVTAQYNLGRMYYKGEGVVKNYVKSYKWLILAKAQSNEDDEKINDFLYSSENKILAQLEQSMTPAQIAEAQELASQFEVQGK